MAGGGGTVSRIAAHPVGAAVRVGIAATHPPFLHLRYLEQHGPSPGAADPCGTVGRAWGTVFFPAVCCSYIHMNAHIDHANDMRLLRHSPLSLFSLPAVALFFLVAVPGALAQCPAGCRW